MRRTVILALRLALRAQIAIQRLLRTIKGRSSIRTPKFKITLSIEIDTSLRIAVFCRSKIDGSSGGVAEHRSANGAWEYVRPTRDSGSVGVT